MFQMMLVLQVQVVLDALRLKLQTLLQVVMAIFVGPILLKVILVKTVLINCPVIRTLQRGPIVWPARATDGMGA